MNDGIVCEGEGGGGEVKVCAMMERCAEVGSDGV